ncbi:MAG: ROK family protein [Alphaproteobacteria bacterium]|nr:ROK family protein [Alphaproteobacteria bacterium]
MIRIGVDFGGTKIEAAALDASGDIVARLRRPNPGAYGPALTVVAELVAAVEAEAGATAARVGVGMPGSISPRTGLIRNANSVWLNGERFGQDLEATLARPVRLANDANCLALSEAADGAGAGAGVVFAAILGTGCGGGLVVDGRLIEGRNGVAGEWGHTPLPWASAEEHRGPACWCGRRGCLETWISGPALAADHGAGLSAPQIVEAARAGEPRAQAALGRYVDRLGRALAGVVDLIDPDVIVLGGGMSNVGELYERLPSAIGPHVFADGFDTPIRPAVHGDSSGVRGAAWLWPLETP